jgi:hypothetical protein
MKNIILIIALFIGLVSCNKNKNTEQFEKNIVRNELPSFESLYKFATDKNTSGNFLIATNTGLGNTDLETYSDVQINGTFLEKNSQQNEAGQTSFFNGIGVEPNVMKPGEVYGYNRNFKWSDAGKLFGTQLSLKLHRGAAASFAGDTAIDYNGGYSPKVFVCSNNFEEGLTTTTGQYVRGTKVKPSFTFTWNKDSLNLNGVFVYVEYDPNGLGNETLKTSYPNREANGVMVDDNGSYTLTSELFADIPLNARLSFRLGRGNFSYIKQLDGSTTDMQMSVLTYQSGEFFYKTN